MRISRFLVLVLALLIVSSSLALAHDKYAGFPEPQLDFQAHIAEVERYLRIHQMNHRGDVEVQLNLPFERKADPAVSYRGKFFLVHGLNDSPYVFTDVASELVARGFDVRAILLPGHGSSPEAQLSASSRRWSGFAQKQLQLWNQEGEADLYLGGFSMGAVIATTLALESQESIDGLLLFSPAFKSSKSHLLPWAWIYSKFKPWVFGGMIIEDNPVKYNSIPINGAAQYHNLTKKLNRAWARKRLDVPVLVVASEDDSVVDIDFLIERFNKKVAKRRKKMIIYSNSVTDDTSAEIEYRNSTHSSLRILNQSHQSVLIAPDNPLYGEDGRVLVCNGNDWPTFSRCLYSNEDHWFGAQNTPSPDKVPVARTTYNPDFDGVFEAFDTVFQKTNEN